MRVLWVDASAGVAGDMLLAALLDAGAGLATVQAAVDAVIGGAVRLTTRQVKRAGLRALRLDVDLLAEDQPQRSWPDVFALLSAADLDDMVRERALSVFSALAQAEAGVHGVDPSQVHFHEVGAWDSIADVVGVCAALHCLDVGRLILGDLALGSGIVRTEHGVLPVPAPAVLELSRGWPVVAGGPGELATPTGVALVTTLAAASSPMPAMTPERIGVGAGSRDQRDRANVVRVVLGTQRTQSPEAAGASGDRKDNLALIETNIDDLDPRVWPSVLDGLLAAGAADAWLTPILMKKGRPGHLLSALATLDLAPAIRRLILDRTPALGVRQCVVERELLDRTWVDVEVLGAKVRIKVGHRDGVVVHATPEFDDVAALAAAVGRPVRDVLEHAAAAAVAVGMESGRLLPSAHGVQGCG